MSILECRGLTKRFGSKTALEDVSFSLEPGHIVGLLGPNGSGKTTLIKLANGLLTPTAGELRIGGYLPGPETKAQVAYLPDRMALPAWMTAKQAMDYYADFFADFRRGVHLFGRIKGRKAEADGAGLQRPGGFVSDRGAVQPCPNRDTAVAEGVCKGLAVHARRYDRKHRRLRVSFFTEITPQSRDAGDGAVEAVHQYVFPFPDVFDSISLKISDARKKPGDPGDIVGACFQTIRQEFRHGLQAGHGPASAI